MASNTKTSRTTSPASRRSAGATNGSSTSARKAAPSKESVFGSKATTKTRKTSPSAKSAPRSSAKKLKKSVSPKAVSALISSPPPSAPVTALLSSPSSTTPASPGTTSSVPGKADLLKELAARELARRRIIPFVQRINPRYMADWVHQDIARRPEKFSQEVAAGTSPRLMLLMPPRHGKALAVGTLVPTMAGFVPVEHLCPGDRVFGRDGRPAKVVAVSEVWRDRELYEVVSDDGASGVVDAEHEWTVRLGRKPPVYKPKTTRELAARTSPRAPALMTYGAVEYPAAELPIDPYVLGVWLGDGCSGHATITQGSQDYDLVRAEIERGGTRTSDRGTDGTFGLRILDWDAMP